MLRMVVWRKAFQETAIFRNVDLQDWPTAVFKEQTLDSAFLEFGSSVDQKCLRMLCPRRHVPQNAHGQATIAREKEVTYRKM